MVMAWFTVLRGISEIYPGPTGLACLFILPSGYVASLRSPTAASQPLRLISRILLLRWLGSGTSNGGAHPLSGTQYAGLATPWR